MADMLPVPGLPDHDQSPRSVKRPLSTADDSPAKRPKLGQVQLDPPVWQHIFTFLDPLSLCRATRVSKLFNKCLLDSDELATPATSTTLAVRDHESIWALSRTAFAPLLPSPLPGISERTMLSLATGTDCQQCGRKHHMRCDLSNVFHAGPGSDAVRIIWPFGVRLCGPCFADNTVKDVDLLVSSMAYLRSGMTFVFLTQGNHYVPPWQVGPKARPLVPLSKVYHLGLIQVLAREIDFIRQEGQAAVSEWQADLPRRGKALHDQSQIWHAWEASINGSMSLAQAVRDYCRPSSASAPPPPTLSVATRLLPRLSAPALPLPQTVGFAPGTQPGPVSFHLGFPPGMDTPLHAVSLLAAKDAKRADIESRCQTDIDPPIPPHTLQHMTGFQAAMQFPQPLNDHTWEVLKSQLVAQREQAEELEYKQMTAASAIQSAFSRPFPSQRTNTKTVDRDKAEYETNQQPIRQKLGELADRHIKQHWRAGKKVYYATAPHFAADVLVQVRAQYMQFVNDEQFDAADPRAFLNLDSMKWVYEHKIKPIAGRYSSELFVCGICEDSRHYAFEGMIQHFGAKHDEDFGENNVIVQWRKAEWTEDPPFLYKGPGVDHTTHEPESVSPPPPTSNASGALAAAASLLPSLLKAIPQSTLLQAEEAAADDYTLDLIASTMQFYWSSLADVDEMWSSVRITAALHYAVKMYEQQFGAGFNLDILADALRRPAVSEITQIDDLACQICISSYLGSAEQIPSYTDRVRNVASYRPLDLIEHFKVVHQPSDAKTAGWLNDMIELPDDQHIRGLMTAVGMNDSKLALLAGAFTRVFPQPLPLIGTVTPAIRQAKLAIAAQKPRKKPKGRDKKRRDQSQFKHIESDSNKDAYDSMPEAAENEYDPRRPRFALNSVQPPAPSTERVDRSRSGNRGPRGHKSRRLPAHDVYATEIPDVIRSSDLPDSELPHSMSPEIRVSANRAAENQVMSLTPAHLSQNYQPQPHYPGTSTVTRMPEVYDFQGARYHMYQSHDEYGQPKTWLQPVDDVTGHTQVHHAPAAGHGQDAEAAAFVQGTGDVYDPAMYSAALLQSNAQSGQQGYDQNYWG